MQQAFQNQIFVLGASWGKDNVTDKIRGYVSSGQTFAADIETFGDNWYGVRKTLAIVFQRNGGYPEIAYWQEQKEHINLLALPYKGHTQIHAPQGALRILGATWGPSDVTAKVIQNVQGDNVEIRSDWEVLGDPTPGNSKALTVVYQDGTGIHTTVAAEGQTVKLHGVGGYSYVPQISILGASWGKDNVTDKIRQFVASGQDFPADIETFGDNWYGTRKTLTIVFQRAGGVPEVAFWQEQKEKISLKSLPYKHTGFFHHTTGKLRILGATFGPSDVTQVIVSKVQGDHLEINSDHHVLGDPCLGNPKALTIVYQDSTGVHTTVVPEGQVAKVHAV